MKKIKYGLVLSGGGIRGVAHVGALKALEGGTRQNLDFRAR